MIVRTLVAHSIARGPMILTECRMATLQNGDKLHCLPDFAAQLVVKYPDNLTQEPHWDRPGSLQGGSFEVERAGLPPKVEDAPKAISDDRSMTSAKARARARARETTT